MANSVIAFPANPPARLVILSSDEHYVAQIAVQLGSRSEFQLDHLESLNGLKAHMGKQPVDIIIAEINANHLDSLMLPCWVNEQNMSARLHCIPHIVWTGRADAPDHEGVSTLRAGADQGWMDTLNGLSRTALTSHARLAKASGIQVEIVAQTQLLETVRTLAVTEHPKPRGVESHESVALPTEEEVVSALATGNGLRVVIQPQYDLSSRRIVGAEALIRWRHPRCGEVPPSVLIPMVNQLGLDLLLFSYLEKTVIDVLSQLDSQGIEIPIAINASARTLSASGLALRLSEKMRSAGLPAKRLKIELTEDMAAENPLALSASITALRAKGFCISLDDFGAGAATLALLSCMPFDEMKIDGALVRAVGQSTQSRQIISGIVGLARTFNINLVTEGIEDASTIEMLNHLGCKTGQGFALGSPMERDDFMSVVRM